MGRPKKETYKIDEQYIEEALLLAGRYSESVKRRDQLRNLMTGNFEYTKDMAIRDLIGGGVRYDTERVQTSNISNQPERIAILLDNDFVLKERRRIQEEARKYKMELDILNRELAVIEVAMSERMDAPRRNRTPSFPKSVVSRQNAARALRRTPSARHAPRPRRSHLAPSLRLREPCENRCEDVA